MATSAGTEENTDICSICIARFKDPRYLTCFHTFCLACLKIYVSTSSSEGKFPCPICRFKVTLPDGGVSALPTDVYAEVRTIKQAHAKEETCGVSQCGQRAVNLCGECDIFLCELCTNTHGSLPVSRTHMLINLDDSSEGKRLFCKERFCEKHTDEKVIFFCKACNKVICRNCKLIKHEGHKTVDISDVVDEARHRLTEAKSQLQKCVLETQSSYSKVETKHNRITDVLKKAKAKINDSADNKIQVINDIRNKAIDKVKCLEKSAYEHQDSYLRSQIKHIDDLLKDGLDCDVMKEGTEIAQRMEDIEKQIRVNADEFVKMMNTVSIRDITAAQTHSVHCTVRDLIMHPLQGLPKDPVTKVIKSYELKNCLEITSITLTQSSEAWICYQSSSFLGRGRGPWPRINYKLGLYNFKQNTSETQYDVEVDLKELKTRGVEQFLNEYISQNENTNIPQGKCQNLKKIYPHKDVNNKGDVCWVDDENDSVWIKLSAGVVIHLTHSPFVESGKRFRPCDVCWGRKDEVYIVDGESHNVVLYSVTEGFQKAFYTPCRYLRPTAVAVDDEGRLWIGEFCAYLSVCQVD